MNFYSNLLYNCIVVIVQLLSHVRLFLTPWTATYQASLSSTISQVSFKFMSIESVMLSHPPVSLAPFASNLWDLCF